MSISITMPRLSDTMEEGTLVKWSVKEGDKVEAGDHVADVETDKATMEVQAFDDGTVAKIAIEEGQTVPVGDLILLLAEEGESVEDAANQSGASSESNNSANKDKDKSDEEDDEGEGKSSASEEQKSKQKEDDKDKEKQESKSEDEDNKESKEGKSDKKEQKDADKQEKSESKSNESTKDDSKESSAQDSNKRLRVSPLAKKIAKEKEIDLSKITGTGPSGRIVQADVLAAKTESEKPSQQDSKDSSSSDTSAPLTYPASLEAKTIKLSNMRKTIAKRLVESKTTIPHFTVTINVDMAPLSELRKTLNDQLASQGIKLSVGDFITRAASLACTVHPQVNSSWNENTIEQHGTVNMGIAVALPEEKGGGLVVPVLNDAQNLGLRSISKQTKALAKKARSTGLSAEDMQGGTFTISNLGMYGVEHFEAIINPPQAAILAIGATIEKPVVRDGAIIIGKEMSVTISGDHRVIDGAIGAEYLQTLKSLLENPAGLLV